MRIRLAIRVLALVLVFLASPQVFASKILLITGGDSSNDAALESVLASGGNTVTVGPTFSNFTGGDLSGYNAVMLLPNGNYFSAGDMPTSGQQALVNFVNDGGGLITGGPVSLVSAYPGDFQTLQPILPATYWSADTNNSPITFTQTASGSVMNSGLPGTFSFAAHGPYTEVYLIPKTGAMAFYNTNQWQSTNPAGFAYTPTGNGAGAAGWLVGAGRTLSLSTFSDSAELNDPNYAQMLNNSVAWVTNSSPLVPVAGSPVPAPEVPEPTAIAVIPIAAIGFAMKSLARPRRSR